MNRTTEGWLNGAIGVLIFSGSLPATRVAVAGFDPMFLTGARASIAGLLALCLLAAFRERRPTGGELLSLLGVALGVVVGFPLLSALALTRMTSAHSLVFVGLLPLATAAFGVLRGGERPRPGFWFFALAGGALVAGFSLARGGGAIASGDLLMLGAIFVAGFGYAEGGLLSRRLGGWRVICWALALSLPAMFALTAASAPEGLGAAPAESWLALAYVALFSMLIGFVFWYRGLALGGIAAVGQLQLLQPLLGLCLAALILGETVERSLLFVTLGVVAAVAGAKAFAK
ncbi:DMT family transporter [Methylosinus sp. Ce-a6]|uniref:DMT family transporter n=1 Tax=Methylosinus sp. Ce-a6 TaxID=2172005 RepID=UPI001358B591|nr:DMT family transporter [Methylosinus sp. Ce-a6]